MIAAAAHYPPTDWTWVIITSVAIFVASASALWLGIGPFKAFILHRQRQYDKVLRRRLLIDVKPQTMTAVSGLVVIAFGIIGYALTESIFGVILCSAAGAAMPAVILKILAARRLEQLESQLVGGIQTLSSGVRAGLNLTQSLELIARDAPAPLGQEISHLVGEYEFGVPLEEAMDNAAVRIGSGDFRLLFAALQTHRQRGGDLGQTLDRIAESIREIQRLENRVKTLTAQGRATARAMGVMPMVVLAILYFLVSPEGVKSLFVDDLGKLLLLLMAVMNIAGFLWIKKIMAIDV